MSRDRDNITWRGALLSGALAVLVIWAVGCSSDLFRLRREGPAPLPPEPQRSIQHEESVRALADWSARMWRLVWARGAEKAASAVGQAAEAAEAVSADVGAPAEPLPLPPAESYTAVRQVPKVLEALVEERGDYLRAQDRYAEKLGDYRTEAVRKTWSFGIPALAPWLGLGLSALVILALVRSALKWKTALWQVFLGVRDFLADKPASGDQLKDLLAKQMDTDSKAAIDGLYKKVGE